MKEKMKNSTLFRRTLDKITKRRNKLLNGEVNCIPWGLPRFEEENAGIEQSTYYHITANSKAAKTQLVDWLFVLNAIMQVIDGDLNIKLKIFYFSLEIASEEKMLHIFSNILYLKEGIRVSSKDLKSTKADNILSEETLNLITKYKEYFEKVEEIVEFVDDHRYATSIFMMMKQYAEANGTHHYKEVVIKGDKTIKVFDYYEPDNPDEYVLVVIDSINLLQREKEGGQLLSLHACMGKLSSQYLIQLRNTYGYSPVVIQQQALASESFEQVKANKFKPSPANLGENKLIIRDVDVSFGITDPYRHEKPEYLNYDITFFKDNIRFLEIIASRDGGAGTICPLYFDGAVNYFRELPIPSDTKGMEQVYKFIESMRNGR